ncbi:unnamed protein product [Durusdinium trenchii]|uniref:UPF0187 protein sll1024 n=2 Tax=Durusdinium trenchii TaxID=1381693 RepID=A0ABP0PC60_9DINO
MIDYELGTWWVCFGVLKCNGSVFPKTLTWSLPMTILAVLLELYWDGEEWITSLNSVWSSYSFVLSFLVVFRNNQAYSRFWEGATLMNEMRGEWLNVCTSLIAFCSPEEEKAEEVVIFQELLVRLMSLLHCSALQAVCKLADKRLELIDVYGIDVKSLRQLRDSVNRCDVLCLWLSRLILDNHLKKVLIAPAPILSRSFQDLGRGRVRVSDLAKIRDIPFPFPYAQLIVTMLAVHSVITATITSQYIHPWYCAGLVTFIAISGFWALFFISAEIDHPFGDDPNDLPLGKMQQDWNKRLMELLQPDRQVPPTFTPHGHGKKAARFSITSYLARSEGDSRRYRFLPSKSTDIFESLDDLIDHHTSMAGEGEEDEEEGPSSRPSQYPPMLLSAADCRSSTVTANPTNDLDLEVCEESRAGFMREFSTTIGRTTKQVDQAQDCLK